MIRAKVLGRKHPKKLSKPDLKATFSAVCLVKTELRSNDLRIQVFCSGKAVYRWHVFRRNPWDGCYVHHQNNDRIKANEDLDFFLWWLWKEPFSMAPQRAVLTFSWTLRTRKNVLFLLQVFDFTRQSIEVIEHGRFQNNYKRIPISRTLIFSNLSFPSPQSNIVILFCHRLEVVHEIALRLRELSVFPPFRANRSC